MNYIKTGVDAVQVVKGEPTTTDLLASEITKKECSTKNMLNGKGYCLKKENKYQEFEDFVNSFKEK